MGGAQRPTGPLASATPRHGDGNRRRGQAGPSAARIFQRLKQAPRTSRPRQRRVTAHRGTSAKASSPESFCGFARELNGPGGAGCDVAASEEFRYLPLAVAHPLAVAERYVRRVANELEEMQLPVGESELVRGHNL